MLATCEYEGRLTDILTRAFSQVETVRSSALFFPSVGSLRNALSSNGADPRKVTGDPGSGEDPGYRRSICDAERRAYHDRTWVPDRESDQRCCNPKIKTDTKNRVGRTNAIFESRNTVIR